MKILKLGYRTAEVPVSKIYPPRAIGNTKIRPVIDWLHMLTPILIVGLGIDRAFRTRSGESLRRASAG